MRASFDYELIQTRYSWCFCVNSFKFSAEEVLEFCSDCVLSEKEDEPCEIPEAFWTYDEDRNSKAKGSLKP